LLEEPRVPEVFPPTLNSTDGMREHIITKVRAFGD